MKAETLSAAEIKNALQTKWAGREVYYFSETDSTNIQAGLLAENDSPHGTLVVAGSQQAGKGRRGRSWASEADRGIFMTLLLRPRINPCNASMLTLVAAMAVQKSICESLRLPTQIKWPNDIVLNGKKICGILTEMRTDRENIGHVLVGIGINVSNRKFSEEISNSATSLFLEIGREVDKTALIAEVLKRFEYYYERFCETEDMSVLCEEYNTYLVNRNRQVRVLDPQKPYAGVAMGINAQGELCVEADGEKYLVSSGEVSVRGIYGYV